MDEGDQFAGVSELIAFQREHYGNTCAVHGRSDPCPFPSR